MTWLFRGAILCSACLLFLVQPLCARMLLPALGGTPAVWTTCMLFFQGGLLLGYAYAHWLPRWLGVVPQAGLHLLLLALAFFTLPIQFADETPAVEQPVFWLLGTLTLRVGLPFVLLAASAPLLQRWFVSITPRDPYFLYVASNLGSFLALGLFPFVLEPWLTLPQINDLWRYGFLALIVLIACCVPWRSALALPAPIMAPSRWSCARWIVLAMIPSSLLLSVTNFMTTDIAAIPLLWLIPLALYLLTFMLAFAAKPPIPQTLLTRWLPLVVLVLAVLLLTEAAEPIAAVIGLHLLGFSWLALVCHGEFARTRPAPDHLTAFYLCLAAGGVLGGVLNALVAPIFFTGLYEYPLMIVAACFFGVERASRPTRADVLWAGRLGIATTVFVLAMQSEWFVTLPPGPPAVAVMFGVPLLICYTMQPRPARFALSIAAVLLASVFYPGVHGRAIYRERSWFGIHRVTISDGFVRLIHGSTVHGQQNPQKPQLPLTYYSVQGPIGEVMRAYKDDPRLRHVGVVGLGTGSLAAYSQKGQQWTFFEIDPTVKRIAEDARLFTYLRDARGKVRVELGDARLQLRHSAEKFGLLIVDAFGSDAIPLHLLTREAVEVYLDHLQADGLLAFHISNRYVDLEPVLAALARSEEPPLVAYARHDHDPPLAERKDGSFPSVWVVLARRADDLKPLLQRFAWQPARVRPTLSAWTDESANLLQVIR